MKVIVLGTGSGVPVPDRNGSGYLFDTGKVQLLIDAGEGTSGQLAGLGIDQNRIEYIIITHTHPDHIAGLFPLLQFMHLMDRRKSLRIYIPEGTRPGFESILKYFQIYPDRWEYKIFIQSMTSRDRIDCKEVMISPIPNDHIPPSEEKYNSFSLLISEKNGGSVLLTSDVNSLDHLKRDDLNPDLLITEYTHIEMEEIVYYAKSKGIERILISHIKPEAEGKAQKEAGLENMVIFTHDGYITEV